MKIIQSMGTLVCIATLFAPTLPLNAMENTGSLYTLNTNKRPRHIPRILDEHHPPQNNEPPSKKARIDTAETLSLHAAARRGDLFLFDAPRTERAMFTRANAKGNQPIHVAARFGHYGLVKFLVEHGVSPFALGENDNMPIHFAARYRHADVVKYLLNFDYHRQTFATNHDGLTPLHAACEGGSLTVMSAIVWRDPTALYVRDAKQRLPLHIAVAKNHTRLLPMLVMPAKHLFSEEAGILLTIPNLSSSMRTLILSYIEIFDARCSTDKDYVNLAKHALKNGYGEVFKWALESCPTAMLNLDAKDTFDQACAWNNQTMIDLCYGLWPLLRASKNFFGNLSN